MRILKILAMILFTFEVSALEGFGGKINLGQIISLEKAIKDFKNIENREVIIRGVVKDVCVKKGCWMTLKNNGESVRVTFKDYGFFVPASLKNKKIKAQGTLVKKMESVSLAKHYLEDKGATKEEIERVKAPKEIFHFIATGVEAL